MYGGKMLNTVPDYYKKFSCIADKCPDTCCAGWEIVVDDEYNPTIIYKEPAKDYTVLYIIGGFAVVAGIIGIILFCNRKRLYYWYYYRGN